MTEIQGESILIWIRDCAIIIRGGGAPKNELRKEEYYTIPPSQQREISSSPRLQISQKLWRPLPNRHLQK